MCKGVLSVKKDDNSGFGIILSATVMASFQCWNVHPGSRVHSCDIIKSDGVVKILYLLGCCIIYHFGVL